MVVKCHPGPPTIFLKPKKPVNTKSLLVPFTHYREDHFSVQHIESVPKHLAGKLPWNRPNPRIRLRHLAGMPHPVVVPHNPSRLSVC